MAVMPLFFLFLWLKLFAYSAVTQPQTTSMGTSALNAMALIAEGDFVMGSNNGPDDEKPEHRVFVKSFFQ
jgi:formylglycine-generating enzyme required for sulfatase activity